METVLLDWPYVLLVVGVLAIAALLLAPRPARARPRFHDPAWLCGLLWPVYMVHQFEEHGVDLLGRRFHFLTEICTTIGHPHLADCPADPAFIFAVNVGGVALAGVLAIAYRHRRPLVGACGWGIPLVNSVAHLGQAVARGAYNSGTLTAAALFVPLSIHVVRVFRRAGILGGARPLAVLASGGGVHAVLLASLLAYGAGWLPRAVCLALQVAEGALPWAVATAIDRRARRAAR